MKVQVINNDGTKVWEFDAEKRKDFSGEWWNDPKNTRLMVGIVCVLYQAYSQADTRPPDWVMPPNNVLEGTHETTRGFLAIAHSIARAGVPGAQPVRRSSE